jgi:hypothetical protein
MPPDPSRLPGLNAQAAFAGILLPLAGVAVDRVVLGQGILPYAPGGLIAAMALGIAALILSGVRANGPAMTALLAGVITAASLVALMVAIPLSLMSAYGAYFVLHGVGERYGLLLVLLGFSTLWTAWVYARRAGQLIGAARRGNAAHPWLLAIVGALAFLAIAFAADRAERAFLAARLAPMTKAQLQLWPSVFAALKGPLCGVVRCRQLVCDRLYEEFGARATSGTYVVPDVPAEHEALLTGFFGKTSDKECPRLD